MRKVPGYGGKYYATEDGQIFNKKLNRFLKQTLRSNGYLVVGLNFRKKEKICFVHRLVLMAYQGVPKKDKNITNHIDGNPGNNHISNLEWCDQYHNMQHSIRIGLSKNKGETHYMKKLDWLKVNKIRQLYHDNEYTQRELGQLFNVGRTTIEDILHNRIWRIQW